MPIGQIIERLIDTVEGIFRRVSSRGPSPPAPEPKPASEEGAREAPAPPRPTPTHELLPTSTLEPKSPLEERIANALAEVTDPGAGMDIVSMGLITHLDADDKGVVSVTFRPSSSVCPLAFQLGASIVEAVESVEGVTRVNFDVENYVRADELKAALNEE